MDKQKHIEAIDNIRRAFYLFRNRMLDESELFQIARAYREDVLDGWAPLVGIDIMHFMRLRPGIGYPRFRAALERFL